MKKILLCILFALLSGCAAGTGERFLNTQSPNPLLYPLEGSPFRLDAHAGKDVAIVFWSTQCSTSMSRLKDFAEMFAEQARLKSVVGMAINIDSTDREKKIMSVINDLPESHLRHIWSGNDYYDESYRAFDVSVVPQFFVIDKEGFVRAEGTSASAVSSYFNRSR